MKKTKDIYINDDYKVRFKLDDNYCTGILMKREFIFWGLIKFFTPTNYISYIQFTFDCEKDKTKGDLVQFGRFYAGMRWTYYYIRTFSFKLIASEIWDRYDQDAVKECVKSLEQEQINKLFES